MILWARALRPDLIRARACLLQVEIRAREEELAVIRAEVARVNKVRGSVAVGFQDTRHWWFVLLCWGRGVVRSAYLPHMYAHVYLCA